mmetsp:Transcript_23450/g.34875  ORF Transcript_23450/g.34875 Transcript_23450/m.34875 type:complete len:93 (-) Transcript_23450:95-373(-)
MNNDLIVGEKLPLTFVTNMVLMGWVRALLILPLPPLKEDPFIAPVLFAAGATKEESDRQVGRTLNSRIDLVMDIATDKDETIALDLYILLLQ